MANATEKKEIVSNNFKEVKVVKYTSEKAVNNFKEVTVEKTRFLKPSSKEYLIIGCGAQGNGRYTIWREQGLTHRQARALRRQFVRDCRGNAWQWPWTSTQESYYED